MPRAASPAVRRALIEHAAAMLARREPVTTRAVAQAAGVSTMALYTHFGGMPGLWRAVRHEGFSRLGARLRLEEPSRDPVRDLVALGAAYVANAIDNPDLYRVMFDAGIELQDPRLADATFEVLVAAAARARAAGRLDRRSDPVAVATQFWAMGHGITMLVLTDVLPRAALAEHVPPMATALLVAAGDRADRCRRSVAAGWAVTPGGSGS